MVVDSHVSACLIGCIALCHAVLRRAMPCCAVCCYCRLARIVNCSDCNICIGAVSTLLRIERCERLQLTAAAGQVVVLSCHACCLHLGTHRQPAILGDCRWVGVAETGGLVCTLGPGHISKACGNWLQQCTQLSVPTPVLTHAHARTLSSAPPIPLLCQHT